MLHSIQLDESELNRVLNYAVELPRVSGIAAELTPGLATINATLSVPANPFGRYLNVTAEVAEAPGGIQIQSLQLGSLPLPGALADWVARLFHHQLLRDQTYAAMADAFSRVEFGENQATLDYRWNPELLTRLERKSVELLIPLEDQARMLVYAGQLNTLLKPYPHGSTIPLVSITSPLFEQACNPVATRVSKTVRHSLQLPPILAGSACPSCCKATAARFTAHRRIVIVYGRRDLAEHFTLSAAISINGGSQLANAIGLFKEEEDAGKGSGFSFTDLAADRAGVRLGERATGDAATRVLQQLAAARTDADLMPDIRDLPEFMPQAEFDRRFGPVGSARYQRVIEDIDARLDAHPLTQ